MRGFALAVAPLTLVLATGCGANPTAPDAPAPVAAAPPLRIAADPVIDMTRNETRALLAQEHDAAGRVVVRPATAYAWSSSDHSVVAVGSDGRVTARANFGTATITVRSPAGASASVRVWVQQPEHRPSTYKITLIFGDEIPPGWRTAFERAADRWERVIREALDPVVLNSPPCPVEEDAEPLPPQTGVETGTRIFIGRRLGSGRPGGWTCVHRPTASSHRGARPHHLRTQS